MADGWMTKGLAAACSMSCGLMQDLSGTAAKDVSVPGSLSCTQVGAATTCLCTTEQQGVESCLCVPLHGAVVQSHHRADSIVLATRICCVLLITPCYDSLKCIPHDAAIVVQVAFLLPALTRTSTLSCMAPQPPLAHTCSLLLQRPSRRAAGTASGGCHICRPHIRPMLQCACR